MSVHDEPVKYPSTAETLLEKFKEAMLEKLRKRAAKHPEDNFLSMGVDDMANCDLRPIIQHFEQELKELNEARGFPANGKGKDSPMVEDVDVANMSFIEWALRWARGQE